MSMPARPRRFLRPPGGRSRAMSTGGGILVVAVGAILRFAVTGGSPHWLNVHVVGVILILVGLFGLLMPRMAASGPRDRLRRWVRPGLDPGLSWGRHTAREEEIQRAAAADVAEVEEDDEFIRPDGPGRRDEDL